MKKIRLLLALAGCLALSLNSRAQFAGSVVSYNSGAGFAAGFTNASAALGAPASGTSVTPFAPPFSKSQIVSLGAGGQITLQLTSPWSHDSAHADGLDLNIFANEFFVSSGGNVSGLFSHAASALVQVSQDGSTWFTLNPALAPPPGQLFPTDGNGDPHIPVDPSLTLADFTGKNLAGIEALYNGSAGGAGYSFAWAQDDTGNSVTLPEVDFVRIEVASGVVDLDAVSIVPEPKAWALFLLGLPLTVTRRKPMKASRWVHNLISTARLTIEPVTKIILILLGSASLACATTITENFTTDPAADGWQIFGDTSLFQWDSTNHLLNVTWDSSQPNSYFYHPLGTVLGGDDNFQVSFDLQFSNIVAGVNPDKPDAIEVGLGFLNFAQATNGIVRASPAFPSAYPDPQNIVEFDYFPKFTDPDFGFIPDSVAPTMISSDYAFDGAFGDFFTMTNGVSYNVLTAYTSSNQTLTTTVTLTGQTNVLITATATLSGTNDFRVDTFSISGYTDTGDDFDSLLANGTVGNIVTTIPPPPVQNFAGGFTNNAWQVQFDSRTNWLYTLQRTTDFQSWSPASAPTSGTGTTLLLQDTNSISNNSFYRVLSQKP